MITIRNATPDDAAAIAEIYVESWRSTYAGVLPDEFLLGLNAADREARWWRQVLARRRRHHIVQVADDAEHGVIGFASGGPARDRRLGFGAEVFTLYLRDDFHGAGTGKRLFVETSERLRDRFGPSLVVWVLTANPSRFFYQALGGKVVARRDDRMGGKSIEELAYGWEDVGELIALGKSGESG